MGVAIYKTKPPLTEQEIREAFACRWGYLGTPENEAWTQRALGGDPEALAELRGCYRELLRRRRERDERRS